MVADQKPDRPTLTAEVANPLLETPPLSLLAELESHLVQTSSPEVARGWTQVRQEILRQDEIIHQARHQRFLNTFRLIRHTVLTAVILSLGTVFVSVGVSLPGCLILGMGLYALVPGWNVEGVDADPVVSQPLAEQYGVRRLTPIFLALATVGLFLLLLVAKSRGLSDLEPVLVLLVGMSAMATLSSLASWRCRPRLELEPGASAGLNDSVGDGKELQSN